MTHNPIYNKISRIQAQIKGLERTKKNDFQGYKYFTEDKAMLLLKPLLEKEKLATTWSDTDQFFYEKQGKDHILRYLKKVIISDGENEPLSFRAWATGQDPDISKAKGKAETYAMKYFLSKFWQIPVVDTLDPDQQKPSQEVEKHEQTETAEEILQRHKDKEKADEFLKKHGFGPTDEIKDEKK